MTNSKLHPATRSHLVPVLAVMVGLLLLIMWTGTRSLTADSLWYDELWAYERAGGYPNTAVNPVTIWQSSIQDPFWPPGYLYLLHGWSNLVGWSELATRSLSLLAGVLGAAWVYRLGRDLISRRIGVYAAVALGSTAFYSYYLHEVRSYSLMALLTVVTLWAYWRSRQDSSHPRSFLLLLFISSAANLYMHYFGALVPAAIGLHHLMFGRQKPHFTAILVALLASAAIFLLWFVQAIPTLGAAVAWQDNAVSAAVLSPYAIVRELAENASNYNLGLLALVCVFALSQRGAASGYIAWVGGVSFGLALIINLVVPIIIHPRYLISLFPLMALGIAIGIDRLRVRGLPSALLVGVWLATGIVTTLNPESKGHISYGNQWYLPWAEFRNVLLDWQPASTDSALMLLPDVAFTWWHSEAASYYLGSMGVQASSIENVPGMDDPAYREQIGQNTHGAMRVFVGDDPQQRSLRRWQFEEMLNEAFISCGTLVRSEALDLTLWARRPTSDQTADGVFGQDVSLYLLHPAWASEGQIRLLVGWSIPGSVPPDTYSYSMQLIGEDGAVAAQFDTGLPSVGTHCQIITLDTSQLARKDYVLQGVVYAWQTGERLGPPVFLETVAAGS